MEKYEYRIEHRTLNNGTEGFIPQAKLINCTDEDGYENIVDGQNGLQLTNGIKTICDNINKAELLIQHHIKKKMKITVNK